ncbi:hypothetical protein D3C87_1736120 [compost metagenome]
MLALALRRRDHCRRVEVEEVVDELVRMLSLDTERAQCFTGKVFLIERDDDAGVAANGGCQHMSIIDIWKRQPFDQDFVSSDTSVG